MRAAKVTAAAMAANTAEAMAAATVALMAAMVAAIDRPASLRVGYGAGQNMDVAGTCIASARGSSGNAYRDECGGFHITRARMRGGTPLGALDIYKAPPPLEAWGAVIECAN